MSGDSKNTTRYKIFTFRVGDDYNPGEDITTNINTLVIQDLPGGVDFTFYIQAKNTKGLLGPLSAPLEYRTVSVAPRSITSLRIVPVSVSASSFDVILAKMHVRRCAHLQSEIRAKQGLPVQK